MFYIFIEYFNFLTYNYSMNDLKEKLQKVGLSEKESAVYLTLLKTGKTTAYGLALKAGLKISTTYVILEELRQKDLVLKIPDSKKQLFLANNPELFFEKLSGNVTSLQKSLPQLYNLSKRNNESIVITYEGYTGIKDSLNYKIDAMKNKDFLGFYSDLQNPDMKLLDLMISWSDQCVKNKIGAKVIAPDSPSSRTWIKETKNKYSKGLKLVNKKLWSSAVSMEVGDDFIRIIDTKDLQATIVDNRKVAEAFKEIFEMVWNGVDGAVSNK